MAERYDLIIAGATLVEPTGRERADLGITEGRIAARGDLTSSDAERRVDASGLLLLPGVIDSQVHFREPGLTHKEDLETGSRAAVLGGVTSVFDEPNVEPTTTTKEALDDKLARASGRMWCNFAFWVGASMENLDLISTLDPLPGSPGIGEVFMGSSTGPLLVADDDSLRKVLRGATRRVAIHAEDEERLLGRREIRRAGDASSHPEWRDVESSVNATRRILAISAETGRPVHVLHVSTAKELPLLADAKKRWGTSCEVTPQHLTFSADDYAEMGTRLQMNTPVREGRHRDALWAAVRDGLFDVIGSDHAPHTLDEKSKPYPESPSGMPGVQTLLPVMLDHAAAGRLAVEDVVRLTSAGPAELFRCVGKGCFDLGYDADLVLVDPAARWEVTDAAMASKCGWTPFAGRTLTGRVIHTFVGGAWAVREGEIFEGPLGRPVLFAPPFAGNAAVPVVE